MQFETICISRSKCSFFLSFCHDQMSFIYNNWPFYLEYLADGGLTLFALRHTIILYSTDLMKCLKYYLDLSHIEVIASCSSCKFVNCTSMMLSIRYIWLLWRPLEPIKHIIMFKKTFWDFSFDALFCQI